ncbi:FecR domain-containing protein [Halobacteriovorax sp. HLS]|uniref:FecR domain-containing protein n=1 Tax=Halobacteriovorax sp. HLS TaxID=2234000 RepID=UPI000FD8AF04|nr:FecR domain-containing protein [Halobacteriovorax sp. HLS]
MKFVAMSLFFFLSFNCFSLPTAEVSKLRGDVFFNGKKLSISDEITTNGVLKTGKKSFVKITIKDWNSSIVLGPKGVMEVDLSSKEVKKKYTFLSGTCRWVTALNKKAKGAVFTKNASVGVRGTDYILKVTKLLGESEIVVIDGEVEFKNINNPSDTAIVGKGQWGGLGGRYGSTIGDILSLPKNVVEAFDKQLKL